MPLSDWEMSSSAESDEDMPHSVDASSDEGDLFSEDPLDNVDCNYAGEVLADMLVQMKVKGRLHATEVCVLAFWAAKAGACGFVGRLAYKPGRPTGNYNRHFSERMQVPKIDRTLYSVDVPGHHRHDLSRTTHSTLVRPAHERLAEEFKASPAMAADLADAIRIGDMPPAYFQHPLFGKAGEQPPQPLALYLDATPYTKNDAILAITIQFLVSGKRHLLVTLRKSCMCRCGCKGWCSLRPIFKFLAWCLQSLARGRMPDRRHDNDEWHDVQDDDRDLRAGENFGWRGVLLQIRGDWVEFAQTLGFPTWASAEFPCLWCWSDKESMFALQGMSPVRFPFRLSTMEDYEAACARCEVEVVIETRGMQARVASLLHYDKRKGGSRGRALKDHVPELKLCQGDRLEPSAGCEDVGAFEHLDPPFVAVFWRCSLETRAKHRNPIFDRSLGSSVHWLVVDELHCIFLGVAQSIGGWLIWHLIDSDAWNVGRTGLGAEETTLLSLLRLNGDLQQFLSARRTCDDLEIATDIGEITLAMIGSKARPSLSLKGGETKTFLRFSQHLLRTLPTIPRRAAVQDLVESMVLHVDTWACSPQVPRDSDLQVPL